MKTKIIALFAVLALAFVGLNTTSCSKDSDSDSTSTNSNTSATTDSISLGTKDGAAFAAAYKEYKANGATAASIVPIGTMITYGSRYKNSNNTAYKSGFITGATNATGFAKDEIEKQVGSESLSALASLLKTLSSI